MAWYFYVRLGVRGDAEIAPRSAHDTSLAATKVSGGKEKQNPPPLLY